MPRDHDLELVAALGARVKAIRAAKALTQAQLAEATGLQPESVSRLETGQVGLSLANLARIAEALDVGFGQLFSDAEMPALTEDEAAWLELWRRLPADRRDVAVRVVSELAKR